MSKHAIVMMKFCHSLAKCSKGKSGNPKRSSVLFFSLLSFVFSLLFSTPVYATLSVDITTGGNWAIGGIKAEAIKTTTGDTWIITNDGDEVSDIYIKVDSTTWKPGTTASAETFILKHDASGSWSSDITNIENGIILTTDLAASGTKPFDLQFTAPTSSAVEGTQQTLTVTLTAVSTAAEWLLNETNCNILTGWAWYTTNGRSACWSKTLADSVSWNKGVGDDTDYPGVYTPASGYTLVERMQAAAVGEWYKIVSNVAGTEITSSHNGSAGYSVISALAVADCIDGTRDLCSTDGCLGTSWTTINSALRTWAEATGKSALPYLATDAGTLQTDNDYWDACSQNSSNDVPLECTDGLFYYNRKACGTDQNYSWAAACGSESGSDWGTEARRLGYSSCSNQFYTGTSDTDNIFSFRVVVRPSPWACGDDLEVAHTDEGAVAPIDKTVTYGTVSTDLTGSDKCWITQNLGATNQAGSADDATEASAGWYWQFNRKQGYYQPGANGALISTATPNTWDDTEDDTACDPVVAGTEWCPVNDPCTLLLGTGWRLPTNTEWGNAQTNGGWVDYDNDATGTFGSVLKIHAAGDLIDNSGTLIYRGTSGYYWSSTQYDITSGYDRIFTSSDSFVGSASKSAGFSVRCLRD